MLPLSRRPTGRYGIGLSLMVRPSFVIGGVAMKAVYSEEMLEVCPRHLKAVPGQKVMVDRFLQGKSLSAMPYATAKTYSSRHI